MSSSIDETLQNHFIENVMNGNKSDKNHGSLKEILNWFRSLQILEKVGISESDVDKAFKTLAQKASTIDPVKFLDMVELLAKEAKTEVTAFKLKLLEQIEFEYLEQQFKEQLATGKARLEEVNDWMKRNDIINKAQLKKEEVAVLLNNLKDKAAIDINDFTLAMKQLADNSRGNINNLIKSITDPGFLTLSEENGKKNN